MRAWVLAGSGVLGIANLALLSAAVLYRSVLAGLCACAGVALAASPVVLGRGGDGPVAALAISAMTLVIGTILLALGQAIWRLLGDPPEEGA